MYQNSTRLKTTGAFNLPIAADNNAETVVITLHVSPAPTTAEDFTVTVEDSADSAYNTVLVRQNMAGVTDVHLSETVLLNGTKIVRVEYANSDGVTVACQITLGEV